MHLVALRALGQHLPLNLKLLVEGAEEQSSEGLEDYVRGAADMLSADAILVCDAGGAAVGQPATTISLRGCADVVVSVKALSSELHSGMFGGAAPDALAALIHMLATLRDDRAIPQLRASTTPRAGKARSTRPPGSAPMPTCWRVPSC
jgi:cysteinylglycine-S-conjugate dipeptidase